MTPICPRVCYPTPPLCCVTSAYLYIACGRTPQSHGNGDVIVARVCVRGFRMIVCTICARLSDVCEHVRVHVVTVTY